MFSKMMLTTMMVITMMMMMMMIAKGDNAGKKNRIKPDFAQFYIMSLFFCFDVSVKNEQTVVLLRLRLPAWAEGGTSTLPATPAESSPPAQSPL